MRLSEAIKLGAMLRPQGFGYFFTDKDGGAVFDASNVHQIFASCALGAVEEVTKANVCDLQAESITSDYPILVACVVGCPACPESDPYNANLFGMIPHLNDDHLWTRERIADFVATVEAQESASCETGAVHDREMAQSGVLT